MKGLHIIFDGSNTAYRANVVVELSTKQGFRTSAIMGTLNILHSTIEFLNKSYSYPVKEVIFAWDKGHSPRRKALFPEYKANRKKNWEPEDEQWHKAFYVQIDVLHENLPLFGVKSFMKEQWEGDDIIYGITEKLKKTNPDDISVIVSTDEDFHQLISPTLHIYSPIKKILYNYDNYSELMGIQPSSFLTYKILKGDKSDGIPGINGIGDVTAKSLVKKYGDMEGLLDNKEELCKSKRTEKIFTPEGLNILDRNNKLINLKEYVDLSPISQDIQDLLEDEPVVDSRGARGFLMKYQLVTLVMKYKEWIQTFINVSNNFYE